MPHHLARAAVLALALASAPPAEAQQRTLQPQDLLRVERIGAIAWSATGDLASVELSRPGRWLDRGIPTAALGIVDVATGRLRTITPGSPEFVGFFGATWSPAGRELLVLSVDTNAVVRPWVWSPGAEGLTPLGGLQLRDALADRPVALWADADHAVFMIRDSTHRNHGPLYTAILRGHNVADDWIRARRGTAAAVSVLDSHGSESAATSSRIVSVNVRSGAVTTLAEGAVHTPRLSPDGRTLTFRRERPPIPATRVATFFGPEAQGESVYDAVNWGTDVHHVDARTGAAASPPGDPTRPGDRRPPGVTLRVTNTPAEGSALWLARPGRADTAIWRGNAWTRDISLGRAEPVRYAAVDGTRLTGWILYPPGHVAGQALPIVTVVYPGILYGDRPPGTFDLFTENFEHPQMLAALGYGVVLPSMPEPERPLQSRALDALTAGVLPLLDTLVARGIADPRRIAVLGQSAGGWATLGLITLTNRFRTAVASASYSDLASLYGTFYGQYRHGDGGQPERAQVLRMLQLERGFYGADAPPWDEPARYRENSPIERAARVETPLLMIHGEVDFVPIQQAEQFFTALYRQDKRVRLLRYAGEGHTISARANVLDMWTRLAEWLRETMPPGTR